MPDDFVLHPHTAARLQQFIANPAHAVLLTAPGGAGKGRAAAWLAAQLLGIAEAKLTHYPYHVRVEPENDNISIETVRGLQHFLQLKTTGSRPLRRTVIIEQADTLTPEAQNALLKTLEEPPADTVLILTAPNARALLPTIRSRVALIELQTPTASQLRQFFRPRASDDRIYDQAYFLSGGLPGLLAALLADRNHPLLESTRLAKTLLRESAFERLARVDALSKQKPAARSLLDSLARIAQTGMAQAGAKPDASRVRQWQRVLRATHQAQAALDANANTKLALTNLMLQL